MDKIDEFIKSITHSKAMSEDLTIEVEETASIMQENGLDEAAAFRAAVKQIFDARSSPRSSVNDSNDGFTHRSAERP